MRKVLLAILITALLSTACGKDTRTEPTDKETVEYFNYNLRADMKYDEIVNLFGQPDGDIGSGIHIYVYDLKDGSKVYIGYTDKIMYARHVNSSGQIIHTII
jgi:hypothetical protein